MSVVSEGRWPPIYSLDDLRRAVRAIVDERDSFDARFYELGGRSESLVCQGDVLELRAPLPMLDAEGEAAVADGEEYEHWLVVSNSCDHERSQTVQCVPLILLPVDLPLTEVETLRRYEYARRFYVPPWPGCGDSRHRVADFTQIATLDIRAVRSGAADVVARLQFPAWAVLHTCLVMYLARDDGRFD